MVNLEEPSCTCASWRKNHLPCKHILAVLTQTEATWECIPCSYTLHPVFTLDSPSGQFHEEDIASREDNEIEVSTVPDEAHLEYHPVQQKKENVPNNQSSNTNSPSNVTL